ncbi:MAG TPA: DUF4012 domain-containing protein [Anaerolineae bacterium]|nr:DUF4012 domain-containing protein [Anaerolineae bacterium]
MLSRLNSPGRRIAVGCGLTLALVGCWCGLLAGNALTVAGSLDRLQSDLAAARAGQIDLGAMRAHVAELHAELVSLRTAGAPLLVAAPYLGWLPGIGNDVKAASALLDAAIELLDAAQIVLDGVEPVWPPRSVDGQSGLTGLAHSLAGLSSQIDGARESLARAASRLSTVDAASLSPGIGRPVQRLFFALPVLQSGFDLLDRAPSLLGFDRSKTYLLLMQNDDELRPTGGFISAVARVTLDQGAIVDLDVRDSYQVDDYAHKPYGPPPRPLLEFMGSELWLFRDANWSPDFPTSARQAAELYTYGQGVPVDGVIGLNQQAVREIVGALGPIEVEPGRPPVDASNLIEYMRKSWDVPPGTVDIGIWLATRKDFIGELTQALLARLQTSPDQIAWLDLGRAIFTSLESRDLLIWIDDPVVSRILAARGWDGAVQTVAGDYWMLVDANVGFNKANVLVESSFGYTVTLNEDGSADANIVVKYRHMGSPAGGCQHLPVYTLSISYDTLIESCYYDYVRLLVPLGAQPQAATSHPVPAEYLVTGRPFEGQMRVDNEPGKTVFATLFVLERGRSVDVAFSYHLPSVADWSSESGYYTLTVQKQPGAMPRRVSVTLVWPEGYTLSQASLPPTQTSTGSATFVFSLATDQVLSVTWDQK